MDKGKGIGFGVFLLTVGLVWVLVSVGVITWSIMDALWTLWPLLLVLIGVNIIFKHNEWIKAGAWVLFLAVVISYGYFVENRTSTGNNAGPGAGDTIVEQNVNNGETGSVTWEKDAQTQSGEFRLSFGASRIVVGNTAANLVEAKLEDPDIKHYLNYPDGKKETVSVHFDKKNYPVIKTGPINYTNWFYLNDNMIWNLNVDTGAADTTLDLSNLKVEKLDIDMGAASMKLIFGDKHSLTSVKVNAGVSKIDIDLPKSVGMRVDMDGALNETNFDELGWEKIGNYYQSPNYDEAASKVEMSVDMGVGKLNINIIG